MEKNTVQLLGGRLHTVYELVRQGSVIYDVGSDHGYLPIALISGGICRRAVVSDLNAAPLESAKHNFKAAGLYQSAEFVQADGVPALTFTDICDICDVAVCGMGGELITKIIDNAPALKNGKVHLLLQPMTRPERLRKYLWDNGFEVEGEAHAKDGGKLYVVISAYFSGEKNGYNDVEAFIGKEPHGMFCKMQLEDYYLKVLATQKKILDGKESAGKADENDRLFFYGLKREALKRIDNIKKLKTEVFKGVEDIK